MLDELADFVLGSVVDLLPFEVSASARRRRYRAGRRVAFRGRVEHVLGTTWTTHLIAERGQLWAAAGRHDRRPVAIPLPDDPAAVVYDDHPGWRRYRSVTLDPDGRRVHITPAATDWDLLRLVIAEGVEQSGGDAPPWP